MLRRVLLILTSMDSLSYKADILTVEQLKHDFEAKRAWGICTAIDLFDCDSKAIRDAEIIRSYISDLCNLIEMNRFGDAQIVRFGQDPKVSGFSFTQLIETSLISGHFAEQTNAAYIDIFSCKFYDFEKATTFSQKRFDAKVAKKHVFLR